MNADVVWWAGSGPAARQQVAVVTVSYNTRELTAFLLWSLHTILDWPRLQIVIVDNGSSDGSAELLAEAQDAGLCVLLANEANRQHGPGLNQGISWLAARSGPSPSWVWVLDSDVVVAQPDALSEAVAVAATSSAAILGESDWDRWHETERFELYSLLIDPSRVWQPGIGPFTDGGDPSFELLSSAADAGLPMAPFSVRSRGISHPSRPK